MKKSHRAKSYEYGDIAIEFAALFGLTFGSSIITACCNEFLEANGKIVFFIDRLFLRNIFKIEYKNKQPLALYECWMRICTVNYLEIDGLFLRKI